jgi:hypothetical protein
LHCFRHIPPDNDEGKLFHYCCFPDTWLSCQAGVVLSFSA